MRKEVINFQRLIDSQKRVPQSYREVGSGKRHRAEKMAKKQFNISEEKHSTQYCIFLADRSGIDLGLCHTNILLDESLDDDD